MEWPLPNRQVNHEREAISKILCEAGPVRVGVEFLGILCSCVRWAVYVT